MSIVSMMDVDFLRVGAHLTLKQPGTVIILYIIYNIHNIYYNNFNLQNLSLQAPKFLKALGEAEAECRYCSC